MPFPQTTVQQARRLVNSFAPFLVYVGAQGFTLSARVVEAGMQPVARRVRGKLTWVEEPAFNVVFEGGKWGTHTLSCSTSSTERIAAHWAGYKEAHTQEATRIDRVVPLEPAAALRGWMPKVGDVAWFSHGMFGKWQGRIRAIRISRRTRDLVAGERVADVSFKGSNGRLYMRKGAPLKSLTNNGRKPAPEAL